MLSSSIYTQIIPNRSPAAVLKVRKSMSVNAMTKWPEDEWRSFTVIAWCRREELRFISSNRVLPTKIRYRKCKQMHVNSAYVHFPVLPAGGLTIVQKLRRFCWQRSWLSSYSQLMIIINCVNKMTLGCCTALHEALRRIHYISQQIV
jgi:hypothetical protein